MAHTDERRDAAELRQRAETLAQQRADLAAAQVEAMSPEEIRQTFHELRVHQIELEMQNEELRRAQEALDESQARYFELYDLAPVGYCIISEKGLIQDANLTVAMLLGVSRGALVKQPITRLIHKLDQDIYYLCRKKLYETGEPQVCELRMVRGTETPFWARLDATLARGSYGAPVCRITMSDVSAYKQVEDALRESEANFRTLAENSPDLITRFDGNLRHVYVNPVAASAGTLSPDEYVGKTIGEAGVPDSVCELWEGRIRQVLETGERLEVEDSFPTPQGLRYFHNRMIPELDAAGRVSTVLSVASDVTERKRAEEVLLRERTLLRTLIDNMPDLVYAKDTLSRFIVGNATIARVMGVATPDELVGKTDFDFYSPQAATQYRANEEQVISTGQALIDREEQVLGLDGKQRWLSTTKVPLRDSAGKVSGLVGIGHDITEHRQLEAQVRQALKMDAVGRLAGGVAHDFNNMLGVILGYTELALEQVDPDEQLHADLEEVKKAAERSASLTRQLLAFARKQVAIPKVLDLNETVEGMLNMLWRLIGEDLSLAWLPGAEVWPVKIDPSQLDQILANLCINARDAIAGVGKVIIETGNASFDEDYCIDHVGFVPGDFAMLVVSDDGCGMDKEILEHLFEPFFTTKGVGQGTGLGLATVYGIIQQNKGFINVYSEPGQGTTFRIYFPAHAPGHARAASDLGAAMPMAQGQETILVVEDEPMVLRLAERVLQGAGYTVLAASGAHEASRLAEAHAGEIHLLITDVIMPTMNGRDLAMRLLALYPRLKLLFMSGYTAEVIAHQGVVDEGMLFIQKPFSARELAIKVRQALDESS